MGARIMGRVASVVLIAALSGCDDFEEGPALIVEVDQASLAFQPTAGAPERCCCTVVGTAQNLSSVPVHATIRFSAHPTNPDQNEGTAVDFMKGLQPNEQRAIRAAGLLVPCGQFDQFELVDVDVRGVWFP